MRQRPFLRLFLAVLLAHILIFGPSLHGAFAEDAEEIVQDDAQGGPGEDVAPEKPPEMQAPQGMPGRVNEADGPAGVQVMTPEAAAEEGVKPPERPFFQPYAPRQGRYGNPGDVQGTAVLNFSDAGLRDILRTITELTGESFIISPGINARISVQTSKPIQRKDVFQVFESILEANGLAAVKAGQYYKIVRAESARQRPLDIYSGRDPEEIPAGDRVMNLVVPVEFVPASELAQVLKPLLSTAGSVTVLPRSNTLLVTDTAFNIKGHLNLINELDSDAFARMEVAFVQVKSVDVKTLKKELSEIFSAVGLGKETPQLAIVPIERLNSIIVLSSTPELMAGAKEWIERLDKATATEGSSIHIYYVKNDKASNIKGLIEDIYGGRRSVPISAPTQVAASPGGISVNVGKVDSPVPAKGGEPVGDVLRIYIYESTNALIIQSSRREYLEILPTIQELDRPPKQVLIDALIAEVKLDESTKYGIQWSILSGNTNVQQSTGIVSSVLEAKDGGITTPAGVAAPSGLSIFTTDASRFFSVIQALASEGDVDVLSNPHIVVKNYERATMNVGSDEPVATQSTQTEVTGTAGIIQNIEYRKTGVILTVIPQITEGGMIAMTIRQEVSDKSTDRTVGNAVYPSFTKREAETSVVARDRETLVIAGLIQEKNDDSSSGIPLLSKIPVLGALFRYTSRNSSKTELVILLTPRIISSPEDGMTATNEVRERLEGLKKLLGRKNGK
ncbi:MAG: type II secretion system secretin GspD [Deltaproteobacteria bacterium]|nr:type II secretion system secretin GspD [Deltaproteobacteria bacterium]